MHAGLTTDSSGVITPKLMGIVHGNWWVTPLLIIDGTRCARRDSASTPNLVCSAHHVFYSERFHFYRHSQLAGESVPEHVAELRHVYQQHVSLGHF